MKLLTETYFASLNKKNEELCGDKVKFSHNEESCIAVLADGLGSGVKANILATLTSEILSTMIGEKMEIDDAVETISATLPICKERGIAYSTFIVLQVFYDGRVFLAEYDSPNVIWMRKGEVMPIIRKTRILNGKEIRESNFSVEPEDDLIMFSDGIIHAGSGPILNLEWDQKEIEEHMMHLWKKGDQANDVVHHLLDAVNALYQGECGDDSSVACIHLLDWIETMVMVGPPITQIEDQRVVSELMSTPGKKIVCGGTTSQIVSRILNKEIVIDSSSVVGDVPPMAYIEGIDLVCEGALTINKCIQYLEKCARNHNYLDAFMKNEASDGAQHLCKFLLESPAIHFLVGTADNPAHQEIAASPISLNKKIETVDLMSKTLKELGKFVTIDMV
ncbi:MAG: SpoIIE family protein phosphatase [Erysipelotrichaceae bacterium]